MKTHFIILSISILSSVSIIHADRILTVRCEPVDTERNVWVFIPSEAVEEKGPLYRQYGDTLLTEVVDGCREWYSFRNDSCYYLGEETRHMRLAPDTPIPTSAFGHGKLGYVVEEQDSGIIYYSYPLSGKGGYESRFPVEGEIRCGDNVRLRCTAVTEIRRMEESSYTSHINGGVEDGIIIEKSVIRWFLTGDPIPVAYHRERKVMENDHTVSRESDTFILESGILASLVSSEEPDGIPDNVEAYLKGDILTVGGGLPSNLTLRIVLTDLSGIPVMERVIDTGDGTSALEIPVPPLATGRYILSIWDGKREKRILLTRN